MDRYDRQLRVWGDDGQRKLQEAKICILTPYYPSLIIHEILKNVLLAGIPQITIVTTNDRTSRSETGSSLFFFDDETLFDAHGLNPAGNVRKTQLNWEEARRSVTWSSFSLIVHVNIEPETQAAWDLLKRESEYVNFPPILTVVTKGRFNHYHLMLSEPHFVINTHPDYTLPAFRFNDPWPELCQFVDSFDLTNITSDKFSKLPYPIIIFKVLKWSPERPGNPKNFKNKIDEFLYSVNLPRNTDFNVSEAKRFAHLATRKVDQDVQNSLELLEQLQNLTTVQPPQLSLGDFNQQVAGLLYSLKEYKERFGRLPLSGNFPDIESASEYYIALKTIYDNKRSRDLCDFKAVVSKRYGTTIPEILIETFCNNLGNISCILPMTDSKSIYSHIETMTDLTQHSYSNDAFIGGLVCQEIIKIITHQYLPINNTFTYDILSEKSSIYAL